MAQSTVFSFKADLREIDAQLKNTKDLANSTFNDFLQSVEKTNRAEKELEATLSRQAKEIKPLRDELNALNDEKAENGRLTKIQAQRYKELETAVSSLGKKYKIENKALKENISAVNRKASSQKRLHGSLKASEREYNRTKRAIDKETEASQRNTSAMRKGQAVRNTGMNDLVRHVRRVETLVVAYYALSRGIDNLATKGVMLNKTVEDGKIGIGALITANTQLEGESEKTRFQASMAKSAETILKLKKASIETSATFPELTSVFQTAIGKSFGAGKAMGATVDEQIQNTIKLSQRLTNIAGATGMEIFKVNQEIRAMLSGDITKDAEIATMLGITSKDIEEAKQTAGGLFKFLEDELAVFDVLETEKSFSKSTARMADAFDTIRMASTEPLFEDLKSGMDEVTGWLNENSDEIVDNYHEVYGSIKDGAKFLMEHKDLIADVAKIFVTWKVAQLAWNVAGSASNKIMNVQIARQKMIGKLTFANAEAMTFNTLQKVRNITATKALGTAMRATPYGLAIWGLTELALAFTDTEESAIDASMGIDQFKESLEGATKAQVQQKINDVTKAIKEQKEEFNDAHQDWRTAQRERSETARGLRSVFTVSKEDVTNAKALSDTEFQKLEALKKQLSVAKEKLALRGKPKQEELDPLLMLNPTELRSASKIYSEVIGDITKQVDEARKNEDMSLVKSLLGDKADIAKVKGEYDKLLLSAVKKQLAVSKETEKNAKKLADAIFKTQQEINASRDENLTNELMNIDKTYQERKKLGESTVLLEEWLNEQIADVNEKWGDKEEQKEIGRLVAIGKKKEAWAIKELQVRKKLLKEGKSEEETVQQIEVARKSFFQPKAKDALNIGDLVGKSIADSLIDGLTSGDFSGMANAISSAMIQPFTDELGKGLGNLLGGTEQDTDIKGKLGAGLSGMGIAIGVKAISTLLSNAKLDDERPFVQAVRKFEQAVEKQAIASERARTFGMEGTALTSDIAGIFAERERLQAEYNLALQRYNDEAGETDWFWTDWNQEETEQASDAMNDALNALQNFEAGVDIAEVGQGALALFEDFQQMSDAIKGTDTFETSKLAEARQDLEALLGVVTEDSLTGFIDGLGGMSDILAENIDIIGATTEGSQEYNDAMAEIVQILGAGTTAQQALDLAESIDIVGNSFLTVASQVDEAVSTLSGTIDSQQNFLDTNRSLIESSAESVVRLNDRFLEEIIQAEDAKEALDQARLAGDPIAELVAQLAKEEEDILSIGQMLIDATGTAYASTDTATGIIENVLDVVESRQASLLSVQEVLLEEQLTYLKTMDATLLSIDENIALIANVNPELFA